MLREGGLSSYYSISCMHILIKLLVEFVAKVVADLIRKWKKKEDSSACEKDE
jgi:hypothetical protein